MLALVELAGRLAVAGAFGLAAVLKLADLPGLRATLYLSRLTRPWVPQLAPLLPATELGLAVALVTAGTAGVAAVGAAGLLVAFTLFLALDPSAGRGCDCFGRRSRSSRRGGIARDLLLLAALVPALAGGPVADRPGVPGAVGAGLAVALTAGVAWAFRRDRAGRARPGGAPAGRPRAGRRRAGVPPSPPPVVRRDAVPFDLPTLDGGRVRLAELLPAGPVLLFVETGCELCALLLPEVSGREDVLVVAAGRPGDVAALASRYGLHPARVALDGDGAVADAYRLVATPGAGRVSPDGILVDADGTPVRRPAVGVDEVRALLAPA